MLIFNADAAVRYLFTVSQDFPTDMPWSQLSVWRSQIPSTAGSDMW